MNPRLAQFRKVAFLVLENFCSGQECDHLMKRGEELATNFNFEGHPSVFQTSDQTRTSDAYFLNSGDRISFFFEKDAFNGEGKLKNDIFHSLNKVGHAL